MSNTGTGVFQIGDLLFDVAKATVDAFVDDGPVLAWGMRIEGRPRTIDCAGLRPVFSCESLFSTQPGRPVAWHEAIVRQTDWAEPENEEGEPRATLYVFEHRPVYNGSLSIRYSAGKIHVALAGKADLMWKPGLDRCVAVSVEALAEFEGVLCGRQSAEAARAAVSAFLAPSSLRYRADERGVARLVPVSFGTE